MDITRRKFIGLSGSAILASFLAPGKLFVLAKLPAGQRFDPSQDYSNELLLALEVKCNNLPQIIRDVLHKDARTVLPVGTIYELIFKFPQNFGLHKAAAWYYSPRLKRQITGDLKTAQPNPINGYMLLGRYKVQHSKKAKFAEFLKV